MSRMNMGQDNADVAQLVDMASPQQAIAVQCSRTTRKPVTPSRSSKRLLLHANSAEVSPDGGIAIEPSDGTCGNPTPSNIFTDHGYVQPTETASRLSEPNAFTTSPSRLANIRVSRANNGSALLQSPARAGHAARMRQIFEDAGRDHEIPWPAQGTLYPQLPNISRKASPTREYSRDDHPTSTSSSMRRPASFCMSTSSIRRVQHKPQVNSPHVSEQSSESWSDDSGYFIAGSRNRGSSLAVPPRDRINDWLTNVSESEWRTPATDGKIEGQPSGHLSPPSSPSRLTNIDRFNKNTPRSSIHTCNSTSQDPFLDFDSTPCTPSLFQALPLRRLPLTTHTPSHSAETVTIRRIHSPTKRPILEDGGVQLSPLSPNVCIERGPSRYHSARASPIKERRMLRYGENDSGGISFDIAKAETETEVQGSPLAPCKIGAGTRFQHARHGARGGGWGG